MNRQIPESDDRVAGFFPRRLGRILRRLLVERQADGGSNVRSCDSLPDLRQEAPAGNLIFMCFFWHGVHPRAKG